MAKAAENQSGLEAAGRMAELTEQVAKLTREIDDLTRKIHQRVEASHSG